jgi:hypothetical protein
MSLELLDAHHTDRGISVTFATDHGIEPLEGSCDEVARLARVMQQIGALAALNDSEQVWLDEVTVGNAIVKLGLKPGHQARVRIIRQ